MVDYLSPADLERLAETVADAVADRLAKRPRLVDRVELARVLGLSVPSIERLQQAGEIPVVRFGRRCLYDPDAVIQSRMEGKGGVDHDK